MGELEGNFEIEPGARCRAPAPVQLEISDFGSEMQDSSNFKIPSGYVPIFLAARARYACCRRNSFNGRTGVPQSTSPPRTRFPFRTPPCPPMIVLSSR